jgi:hypothetical protein
MADLVKKLNKAGVGLQPGEAIVAAMVLHPSGMARRVAIGGALGAALGSRLSKRDDGSLVSDSGIAAQMPDGPLIIGLTPERALVYSQSGMSGKPTGVQLAIPRRDVVAIEVGKDKIGASVTLAFSDGTGRFYETPVRNKNVAVFVDQLS